MKIHPNVFSRGDFLWLLSSQLSCIPKRTERWRGFNLQEKFTDTPAEWANLAPEWGRRNEAFRESDFALIAELGFNFVRLPMSYKCWTDPNDPYHLLDHPLREIDQAVRWAREYGLHVCLNFHRAPGFCINDALMPERWNLWTDEYALEVLEFQWREFATRYRNVPGDKLSFNLLNEPNRCTAEQYARVIRRVVSSIRHVDPDRMVMIDGLFGEAMAPVLELCDLKHAVHSTRGYAPFQLTHYLAPWAGPPLPPPSWPLRGPNATWDREQLHRWCIYPWEEVQRRTGRVFVGEWGCWNKTPHKIVLAWMRDMLTLWNTAGWGWALWCFRGSFGPLDSEREDVRYENWRGHKVDRAMLDLLREF